MSQPLSFTLNPNAIVVGQNSTLTLTLTNSSEASMDLVGGAPVAETEIGTSSPSSFYLDLGTLINASEFANIVVTPPAGWTVTFWPDAEPPTFGLCPSANLTFPIEGQVSFSLANILATESPQPGQMNIDYFNFGTASDGPAGINVFLQNPPGSPPLNLVPSVAGTVYTTPDPNTPITNMLILTLTNMESTPIVPAGTPWNPSDPPTFNLTFNFANGGSGIGALTTAQLGERITITVREEFADAWENPTPNVQGSQPYWTLQPKAANLQVLPAHGIVELLVAGIQTDFFVGSLPDATSLYVQSTYVPQYDDGNYAAGFTKAAGPEILTLYCSLANLLPGQPATPVTLAWSCENIAQVSFTGAGTGEQTFEGAGTTSATMTPNVPIVMTANTDNSNRKESLRGDPLAPSLLASFSSVSITTNSFEVAALGYPTPFVVAPNAETIYAFAGDTTGFVVLPVPGYACTTYNFASAIPDSYGTQNGTLDVALSPDGSLIYVLVQTEAPNVLILTVSVEDNSVAFVTDLGVIDSLEGANLAFSPDGSTLYVSSSALDFSSQMFTNTLYTVLPPECSVQSSGSIPPLAAGASPQLVVGALNGGYALIANMYGFEVVEAASVSVEAAWENGMVTSEVAWDPSAQIVVAPDGTTLYTASWGASDGLPSLFAVSVDPQTYAFTLLQQIALATGNDSPPLTLSADGAWLYVSDSPDLIRVFATASFSTGTLVTFTLQNVGAMPSILFPDPQFPGVFHTYFEGTWTVITVDPWPWSPPTATQAPQKVAGDAS